MRKVATPVSKLFREDISVNRIISSSDCLEGRDFSVDWGFEYELFHCEVQPIHDLTARDWNQIKLLKSKSEKLELVSFHIASCCARPEVDGNGVFQVGGKIYNRDQMLENAIRNIKEIRETLGPDILIAVENNNWLESDAYQWVTDGDFISDITREADVSFLFDYAHAWITASRRQISFNQYMRELPMERVIQVHLSKCSEVDGMYVDSHDTILKADLNEIWEVVKDLSAKYFTIEYYQDSNKLVEANVYLRSLLSLN
jgi:uncharacterized protein (UPF0276 family)